jgi:hypothetical protein
MGFVRVFNSYTEQNKEGFTMELAKANTMAVNLMTKHGLIARGWRFEFDNAKKRLGVCKPGLKVISMSHYFVSHATEEEAEQIMLHEIAHALLPSSVQPHGAEWKAKAASIGYKGKRTANNPYARAQEELAKASLPLEPAPIPSVLASQIASVGVGSVVVYQGAEYVIFKRATKRWHARNTKDPLSKLTIPFAVAHKYVK